MKFEGVNEKTVLIVKPDGVQRGLVGEVLKRLEMKGLKIAGLKMMYLNEEKLREHYAHHVEKPFYPGLEKFMKSSPGAEKLSASVPQQKAIHCSIIANLTVICWST